MNLELENKIAIFTGGAKNVDGGYVHLDRACTQPTSHLKRHEQLASHRHLR